MPLVLESSFPNQFLTPHKRNRESVAAGPHFSLYLPRKCAPPAMSQPPLPPLQPPRTFAPLPSRTSTQCSPSLLGNKGSNTSSPYPESFLAFAQHPDTWGSHSRDLKRDILKPAYSSSSSPNHFFEALSDSKSFHPDTISHNVQDIFDSKNLLQYYTQSPPTEQFLDKILAGLPVNVPSSTERYYDCCSTDVSTQTSAKLSYFSNSDEMPSTAQPTSSTGISPLWIPSQTTSSPQTKSESKGTLDAHPQSSSTSVLATNYPSPLPMFKVLDTAVWKGSLIGQGFSGAVHRGIGIKLSECDEQVQKSQPIAVKISNSRVVEFTKFTKMSTFSREFEVLKFLYKHGVPVPKPLNFTINSDANGKVQTVLSMDLVEGVNLREWINTQTDCVIHHKAIRRTIHPITTPENAKDRIDIALSLVDALQKLHSVGVFVDLKPRNIMVTGKPSSCAPEQPNLPFPQEHMCTSFAPKENVTLVDMGGVVLRVDVEPPEPKTDFGEAVKLDRKNRSSLDGISNTLVFHDEIGRSGDAMNPCPPPRSRNTDGEIPIVPSLHRRFLEATCSYLSPEVAAAIVHHDYLKNNLSQHYKLCLKEALTLSKKGCTDDPAALLKTEFEKLTQNLTREGILFTTQSTDYGDDTSSHRSVFLGERSSIFSLGFILVELFGGLRTGLTGLCCFSMVHEWFLASTRGSESPLSDCEFRIVLEWNVPQLPITMSTSPTPHEYFDRRTLDYIVHSDKRSTQNITIITPPTTSTISPQGSSVSKIKEDILDNSQPSKHVVLMSSFYDVFKRCCYPKQGLLSSVHDAPKSSQFPNIFYALAILERTFHDIMAQHSSTSPMDTSKHLDKISSTHPPGHSHPTHCHVTLHRLKNLTNQIVEFVLDKCLEFAPSERFSYQTLRKSLCLLRSVIVAMQDQWAQCC